MYAPRPRTPGYTRERILGAVRGSLADGTFHRSTVEEIAIRAGVSRATLYNHFPSRLSLVDALCETFDENPALVAIRGVTEVDDFIRLAAEFWAAEEQVLIQLYGVCEADPAAQALVSRQQADRYNEINRLLEAAGRHTPETFATLALLTSFESYEELRRRVGLEHGEVVGTLQAAAARLL
jgi:AcrR family transcriptional regulator